MPLPACRKTCRACVVMLACGVLASCIVLPIPTPGHKVLAGQPVAESQIAFIRPGSTTRAEVVKRLGPPDVLWEDADIYVYEWDLQEGMLVWAVAGGYQATGGVTDIPSHHLLLVRFDAQGKVRNVDKLVRPLTTPYADFLREWAKNHPR